MRCLMRNTYQSSFTPLPLMESAQAVPKEPLLVFYNFYLKNRALDHASRTERRPLGDKNDDPHPKNVHKVPTQGGPLRGNPATGWLQGGFFWLMQRFMLFQRLRYSLAFCRERGSLVFYASGGGASRVLRTQLHASSGMTSAA